MSLSPRPLRQCLRCRMSAAPCIRSVTYPRHHLSMASLDCGFLPLQIYHFIFKIIRYIFPCVCSVTCLQHYVSAVSHTHSIFWFSLLLYILYHFIILFTVSLLPCVRRCPISASNYHYKAVDKYRHGHIFPLETLKRPNSLVCSSTLLSHPFFAGPLDSLPCVHGTLIRAFMKWRWWLCGRGLVIIKLVRLSEEEICSSNLAPECSSLQI